MVIGSSLFEVQKQLKFHICYCRTKQACPSLHIWIKSGNVIVKKKEFNAVNCTKLNVCGISQTHNSISPSKTISTPEGLFSVLH